MPGVAPVAEVGVEFQGRVGGGDLVFACSQCRAFGRVFAFAADRTFGGVVHRRTFREFPSWAIEVFLAKTLVLISRAPTNSPATIQTELSS